MYKDMITKEIMQECIDQGMTQTEMAVRLDTSFETIHRLLKQYDLKPAYNHDTGKYDEEKMKRCLQQGMTAKEIAQAFGVISTTVSRWKKPTELKKYEGILGQIQSIEDALTRVQARKQKAIETLHKFGYDDAKLELATMQLEFAMQKPAWRNKTWQ